MLEKERGFTLIEMLIVVAIIGILAALLVPNAMSALQKAKQKGTAQDINAIGTAMVDYLSDKGTVPTHTGQITSSTGDTVISAIQGFYLKVVPVNDQWGRGYWIYTGTNCSSNPWSVAQSDSSAAWGADEFMIGSSGRNASNSDQPYSTSDPSASLYTVSSMTDFDKEIVNWNGSMVIGPRTTSSSGT